MHHEPRDDAAYLRLPRLVAGEKGERDLYLVQLSRSLNAFFAESPM